MSEVTNGAGVRPYEIGRVVSGSGRFFGRQRELDQLAGAVLHSGVPRHLQIIGETRSGKSSLLAEFLLRHGSDVRSGFRLVSLDLTVSFEYGGTKTGFYQRLVEYMWESLLAEGPSYPSIANLMTELRSSAPHRAWPVMQRLFQAIERENVRYLFLLDEFDATTELFAPDPQAFKILRHMASTFDCFTFVTASRRSIDEIEAEGGISSNLAGVMPDHLYLGWLDEAEIVRLCVEPARRVGVELPRDVIARVLELSGGHPCLAQRLCHHLFERNVVGETESALAALTAGAGGVFGGLYAPMPRRLRRANLWEPLVDVLTRGDVDRSAADRLSRLGYLVRGQRRYEPFTPLLVEWVAELEANASTTTATRSERGQMTDMQSTFLSYGGPDTDFAQKLNDGLRAKGVATYFFAKDAKPGQRLHRLMREGVNAHDRILLICSQTSLVRPGVLNEITECLARESRDGGKEYLIPITLDEFVFADWAPADPGLAQAVRDRVVADFRGARTDDAAFSKALARLVAALVTPGVR